MGASAAGFSDASLNTRVQAGVMPTSLDCLSSASVDDPEKRLAPIRKDRGLFSLLGGRFCVGRNHLDPDRRGVRQVFLRQTLDIRRGDGLQHRDVVDRLLNL